MTERPQEGCPLTSSEEMKFLVGAMTVLAGVAVGAATHIVESIVDLPSKAEAVGHGLANLGLVGGLLYTGSVIVRNIIRTGKSDATD